MSMKTTLLMHRARAVGQVRSRLRASGAILFSGLVLATAQLGAFPVVSTLGGGPAPGHPSYFGFITGDTAAVAQFHTPVGIAADFAGTLLYVADRDNNAIRRLDLVAGQTITFATFGMNKPVGVAVDGAGNVFVLNQGNGSNGSVEEFNSFGNFLGT